MGESPTFLHADLTLRADPAVSAQSEKKKSRRNVQVPWHECALHTTPDMTCPQSRVVQVTLPSLTLLRQEDEGSPTVKTGHCDEEHRRIGRLRRQVHEDQAERAPQLVAVTGNNVAASMM